MNIKENLDRVVLFIAGAIVIIALIYGWTLLLSDPFQLIDILYFGFLTLISGSIASGFLCYGVLGYVPILH